LIGDVTLPDFNEAYDFEPYAKPLQQTVNIPNPLYKSLQGKYFIGQTPPLFLNNGSNAWAALANPEDSGRVLFFNVFTVSNFSSHIIGAQLWLNTNPPGSPAVSSLVSPADTALCPKPEHRILLQYVQSTGEIPYGGVNIFDRIVPSTSTLVSQEDGKIIIPPGGNVVLFLKSSDAETTNAIVAFGWWEEREK
jgi:hypothetical protein